jgi:hypothetical protein
VEVGRVGMGEEDGDVESGRVGGADSSVNIFQVHKRTRET